MKIFTLESKKNLFVWTLILAGTMDFIFSRFLIFKIQCESDVIGTITVCDAHGWPFLSQPQGGYAGSMAKDLMYVLWNFIFWILVAFIILSLIRHFRIKKNQPSS